ncbi:MAG: SPFH/Band 7/PHB domain protein [Lachnospiraceae bacterium]|uniref:SPFH/Band 7/PHB domain protein n=1 Tax=Candidatus Weimeria bifida TaxID=2599074 RepID=A0A6N7IZB0_9FIRM|nr:SPFH/Band 7/PHB domain protein [Candidatus Weimeria bifida]RRF97067.1 MAG: SPFH/Band 7/PHB domain protein [Lachnospiraceae bacterium]
MGIFFIVILIVVIIVLAATIKIVPESNETIVERLGKYNRTMHAGVNFKIPFVETVRSRVSLKERVLDFPPQPVITKDNVTMMIDSVVYMKVFDSKLYTYKISNPNQGVETLSATTLRNLVGALTFDETLTSRDTINAKLQTELDEATDEWGIKITRVEVKNIQPPKDIQEVMTKQMRAEREKRQAITEAEAHKQSVVTTAEGDKQAKVLAAQAEAEASVARAEGEAKATRLRADAEAYALKTLTETGVSPEILKLKGYEAIQGVANGNATKIFMPASLIDEVSNAEIFGEGLKSAFADASIKPKKAPDMSDPHMNIALSPRSDSKIHQQVARTSKAMENEEEADEENEENED